MRRSAASHPSETSRTAFAEDVAPSLALTPRQLPSRYLYDALGSSLFEAICRLPWYRIATIEQALLSAHARAIFSRLQPVSPSWSWPGSGSLMALLA
jgi:uncharacterized SAM-dependent methyltransferase